MADSSLRLSVGLLAALVSAIGFSLPAWKTQAIRSSRNRLFLLAADLSLFAIFFTAGFLQSQLAKQQDHYYERVVDLLSGPAWVSGRIEGDLLYVERCRKVEAGSDNQTPVTLNRPLPLLVKNRQHLTSGEVCLDRVVGFTNIQSPRGPRFRSGFDDKPYLRAKSAYGWAKLITITGTEQRRSKSPHRLSAEINEALIKARRGIVGKIRSSFAEPAASFAIAFLIGKENLPSRSLPIREIFNRSGTGHLLAVSGLHVAMISGILLLLLTTLPITPKIRFVLLALSLAAYGCLTGWSTSITRAVSIGVCWSCLSASGRRPSSLTLWLLAMSIYLWIKPSAWQTAAFQLSFLVSGSIIGILRGPLSAQPHGPSLASRFATACSVLLAAQASVFPLSLAYFGGWSYLYIATNAILIPLAGILMPILILSLLFSLLPGFPVEVTLAPARFALSLLFLLAEYAAPFCQKTDFSKYLSPQIAISLSAAITTICLCTPLRRLLRLSIVCLCVLLTLLSASHHNRAPLFTMLDVGQGECWLLLWPHETWLIDTGPPPRTADRPLDIIPATLAAYGRSKINRLFLTHDDIDHTGGLAEIEAAKIKVLHVYHPKGWSVSNRTQNTLKNINFDSIIGLCAGDFIAFAHGCLKVINPRNSSILYRDKNAGSLAMLLTYHGRSILFCADVPGDIEVGWLDYWLNREVTIVTAAHHGSAGSTPAQFLKVLSPQAVFVSAGYNNPFGHPSSRVIDDILISGARLVRTDLEGSVEIRPRESGWKID